MVLERVNHLVEEGGVEAGPEYVLVYLQYLLQYHMVILMKRL